MMAANGMFLLLGALGGALLAFVAMLAGHRRARRPHEKDPIYAAARFAAAMHLKRYGILTHAVLKDALSVPDMTAERYLMMLERHGVIKRHGHGPRTFYTKS